MKLQKRKIHFSLLQSICLFVLVGLLIIGCAKDTEIKTDTGTVSKEIVSIGKPAAIRAADSLGRIVQLDKKPERIVIAGKATMISADALYLFPEARTHVVGLGLTNQGLGDFYRYLAPELPVTTRLNHNVGAEEIASKQPDLVLIKSRLYNSLGKKLEQLGITVFTLDLESPESYIKEITQLGILLQEEERATQITDYYQNKIDSVAHTVSTCSSDDQEDVLMLYCSIKDGVTAFQTAPKSWIQTFMTESAGAHAIWKDDNLLQGWKKVNFEQIAAWDPDRVYIISYKTPTLKIIEQINNSPLWQGLSAYKNGKIKAFPADYHNWAQPDTRWILGLLWLSHDLHPECYEDTSFADVLKEFYSTLYQIEDESILQDILKRYETSLD